MLVIFGFSIEASPIYAQKSSSQSFYIKDSTFKIIPSKAISDLRKGDYKWIQEFPISTDDITPFESSYQLDVFSYFTVLDAFSDTQIDSLVKTDQFSSLSREHLPYYYKVDETYKSIADELKKKKLDYVFDSELKKAVYEGSPSYKELKTKLIQIKNDYVNDVFYFLGSDMQFMDNFTTDNADERVDYDLMKHGFFIKINGVRPFQCSASCSPKTIREIEFKQLKTYKKYGLFQSPNSYNEYLFFPVDMANGLEIENNRESIEMLFLFTIKGMGESTFADKDFLNDNHGKSCKVRLVKGGALRVVGYNKKTDKIYFDKLYSTQ
jgi:hypothetical protein